jgi:hypothetical protein
MWSCSLPAANRWVEKAVVIRASQDTLKAVADRREQSWPPEEFGTGMYGRRDIALS